MRHSTAACGLLSLRDFGAQPRERKAPRISGIDHGHAMRLKHRRGVIKDSANGACEISLQSRGPTVAGFRRHRRR